MAKFSRKKSKVKNQNSSTNVDPDKFCGLCSFIGSHSNDGLCSESYRVEAIRSGICDKAKINGRDAKIRRKLNPQYGVIHEYETVNRSTEMMGLAEDYALSFIDINLPEE